jgi:SpoVK/Ycf46/Vps4 family AAA+-type ATPase
MARMDAVRNGSMTHVERLLSLFTAYRERNEDAFNRAAEAIIADELAANHHAQARDLQRALATNGTEKSFPRAANALSVLPKARRYGEPLVAMSEPRLDVGRVVLTPEAKSQVDRIVKEHSHRLDLATYGYAPKTNLLFWGPPGCGKTLTAHLLASELHMPLGVVRLSALITSYLGETASHIQRVFDMAQNTAMVLLLDEADAIAKDRDDRNDVGELKRVVNSLLQAVDSFQSKESIVIAASNHQYLLDDALWRRFDDLVLFPLPTATQVRTFMTTLLNGVNLSGKLDPAIRSSRSLSFAQIEKATIEVIKTMILDERKEISPTELAEQIKHTKSLLRTAKARQQPKTRKHE